jgi:transcriptional regulator with XRE-family HTH domain
VAHKYNWSEMITYLINVRGLTKVAIAQSTGLSDGHIRNLEIGKRGKSISFNGGMALIEFYNSEVKKEKRKKVS